MTKEQELVTENNRTLSGILELIGHAKILEYLEMSFLEKNYDLEKEIENSEDYIKNETDSYRLQKAQERKVVKRLKKALPLYKKLLATLNELSKLRKQIVKLEQY